LRILVTGAAGFIGIHVLKRLVEMEVETHGIDNFSNYYSVDYKKWRLKTLNLENKLSTCDVAIFEDLNRAVSQFKPNYIVHLAAQAGVRLSLERSHLYLDSNIMGFHNVVRCAVANDVEGILYASSSSVYGDSTPTPYKESYLALNPRSIYGATKLANEVFSRIYAESLKLRFRGLRFFTVYGPLGRPDMAYFRLAVAALGQKSFTLFGDGSIQRDFTFIDDVVESTLGLLQDLSIRKPGYNDVVNVGGGRPIAMNRLIDLFSQYRASPIEINKASENKLDSQVTMADNSYLKSILGNLEFTDLEFGIEKLMAWADDKKVSPNLLQWIKESG